MDFQDLEDPEDTLSFRYLPIHNFQFHDDHPNTSSFPDDDFFEFIPNPKDPNAEFLGRRSEHSLPTPASTPRSRRRESRSRSSMKMTSPPSRSKKHAGVFGLPKFPPQMELSDMRRRQSRRSPTPLLSAENDGEEVDGRGRRERWGLLWSLGCGPI